MSAYGIGTKIGLAFGGSIAAYVIGLIGFDPTAATQPANIVNTIFHMTITPEMIIYGIALLLFVYLFKIEKKLPLYFRTGSVQRRKACCCWKGWRYCFIRDGKGGSGVLYGQYAGCN